MAPSTDARLASYTVIDDVVVPPEYERYLINGGSNRLYSDSTGAEFGLVGEKYGWMVEIDPDNPRRHPLKHTALGRFRHENITMRVEPNKKLVAYMGDDDRRGSHTYLCPCGIARSRLEEC